MSWHTSVVDKKGIVCESERIFAYWRRDEEIHEKVR